MSPLKPLASAESPQVRPHNSLIRVSDYAAVILAATVMGLANANARDFQATDTQPQDHPTVQAIVYMDQLVRDRTQGRHRINVFHSGTLGEQTKTFEQTRLRGNRHQSHQHGPVHQTAGVAGTSALWTTQERVAHLPIMRNPLRSSSIRHTDGFEEES